MGGLKYRDQDKCREIAALTLVRQVWLSLLCFVHFTTSSFEVIARDYLLEGKSDEFVKDVVVVSSISSARIKDFCM